MRHFLDIQADAKSLDRQRRRGSFDGYAAMRTDAAHDELDASEVAFLNSRDSFYLASVSADGWPYVQHRGGPVGFVQVIDGRRLVWAERLGNRQFLTAGHIDGDDRVALIAVDYPTRTRLKVLGHARWESDPTSERLEALGIGGRLEGLMTVDVIATEWNCPKYITERYTADHVATIVEPLRRRIEELELAASARAL